MFSTTNSYVLGVLTSSAGAAILNSGHNFHNFLLYVFTINDNSFWTISCLDYQQDAFPFHGCCIFSFQWESFNEYFGGPRCRCLFCCLPGAASASCHSPSSSGLTSVCQWLCPSRLGPSACLPFWTNSLPILK